MLRVSLLNLSLTALSVSINQSAVLELDDITQQQVLYSVSDELCSEENDLKSKFFKPLLTAATILTISVKKLHIFVEKLVRNPTMCLLKLWDL